MSKTAINQFSTLSTDNTDINGINVNTGWPPSNVGPAFRELMAMLADVNTGQAAWSAVAICEQPGTTGTWMFSADTATPANLSLEYMDVNGTVTTGGTLSIAGAASINGALSVAGGFNNNGSISAVDSGTGGIIVNGTVNVEGANIALQGNGTITPNKYIRAFNGALNVVNSAYNAAIFSISDNGDAAIVGAVVVNGGATLNGGATVPTLSTSDNSSSVPNTGWVRSAMANIAAAAGFSFGAPSTSGHFKFPSWLGGFIINWGRATYTSNGSSQTFIIALDQSYPNAHIWASGNIGTGSLQAVLVGVDTNNGDTTSIRWGSVSTAGGLGVEGFWLSLGF